MLDYLLIRFTVWRFDLEKSDGEAMGELPSVAVGLSKLFRSASSSPSPLAEDFFLSSEPAAGVVAFAKVTGGPTAVGRFLFYTFLLAFSLIRVSSRFIFSL